MSDSYPINKVLEGIAAASKALEARKEEINRLNVFPVPDGDTGTNMSLTVQSVVKHLQALSAGSTDSEKKKAITTGALMGARGNSGVITSQILRGFCEGWGSADRLSTELLGEIFAKAEEVAFQAVRKPVEGTILTVLHDCASVAKEAANDNIKLPDALDAITQEAFASVERTPEFLPILKDNGVVDAGGFGLAILIEGFTAYVTGRKAFSDLAFEIEGAPKVEIEQIDDWEDANFRYCNEFLVDSETLDPEEALDFLSTMGDCELCVGATPKFKVHVHSDTPDKVLKWFLDRGQISEVFIHNMDMQSRERTSKLKAEKTISDFKNKEKKPLGFVAVAPGSGNKRILESLGVDVVVSGGQTMNPSTKDLLDACNKVNADAVIILPNNSNIIMAANSASENADKPTFVVPTKSVPQAFSAMFVVNEEASPEHNAEAMADAASQVKTGEITVAIKESKDAHDRAIAEGDTIGIADGAIEAVGSNIEDVFAELLSSMDADEFDNLTLLAGADLSDDELGELARIAAEQYDELEIDAQRGEQPLYPLVFSLE